MSAAVAATAGRGTIIGREPELALLRAFVDGVRTGDDAGNRALVLTGEIGIGKSALLDRAAEIATGEGFLVLRAAGVEFEAEVGFAGLNQLFLPVVDALAELEPTHRDALTVSLGFGAGPPVDRLLVSTAALTLLDRLAASTPVLLVVDDLPWIDRASAGVLAFVARRLQGARGGLLAARRSTGGTVPEAAGSAEHEVPPLPDAHAADLLRSRHPGLAPRVAERVLAAAQGVPLALLELPDALTGPQRTGAEALPPVLPLSSQLRAMFATRVESLPSTARRLLLLLALDGSGDLAVLRGAWGDDGWLDALAPAEQAGLVGLDESRQRVALRHPLLGSAVMALATTGERRQAHAALAAVLVDHPDRRAWHLAEATLGWDEQAAGLLETVARRALHRGDAHRAVSALLRAADLSQGGRDRGRRLAEAAYIAAEVAGEVQSVPELLQKARSADPYGGRTLPAAVAGAHHLLNVDGDVTTAHRMLVRALDDALLDDDATDFDDALHTLMVLCHFSGRHEFWGPFDAAVDRLGARAGHVAAVARWTFGDVCRAGARDLRRLEGLVAGLDAETDPVQIVRVAIAAFHADRLAGCRAALWRVVRDGRAGGSVASAVNALMMLCHDAFAAGRWDEAQQLAEEGISWGATLGYRLVTVPGEYCLALLAAVRGDGARAGRLADELAGWGAPRSVRAVEQYAARARGLAALGRGDVEEAYRQFTAISPAGTLAAHVPLAAWVAFDLVESAVRSGRHAEAAAHVAAMQELELFRSSPRPALVAAGAAALVAPVDAATAAFEHALGRPGADAFPFELARVRLAYGEHLRRVRATRAAREQLSAALDTFRSLGSAPWTARAEHELRAGGLPQPRPESAPGAAVVLTSQEHEIALLAATGLTNKEIGARLYVSPRTVSAHLYRIFPRLGITSRAALRDALAQVAPPR